MEKLKVGVIGLTVGVSHIKDYLKNPNIGEIVLCDIDFEKCKRVGEEYKIEKLYNDYKQMLLLEKPQIVSVCVPNFLHKEVCLYCLNFGADVLCEKPLGRNQEECLEIIEKAKEKGRKLMVNFNRRYTPEAQSLKEEIGNGALGEIYFAKTHWKRTRGVPWWFPLNNTLEKSGGGAFIDLGVHMLDLCLWLMNYPKPSYVLGKTFLKISKEEAIKRGFENFDGEEMGVAMVSFENGAMVETEISWASNREVLDDEIYLRLYGTKGGAILRYSLNSQGFKLLDKTIIRTDNENAPFNDELKIKPCLSVRDAFIDLVLENKETKTLNAALTVAKIIDGVYASSKEGKPITIKQ